MSCLSHFKKQRIQILLPPRAQPGRGRPMTHPSNQTLFSRLRSIMELNREERKRTCIVQGQQHPVSAFKVTLHPASCLLAHQGASSYCLSQILVPQAPISSVRCPPIHHLQSHFTTEDPNWYITLWSWEKYAMRIKCINILKSDCLSDGSMSDFFLTFFVLSFIFPLIFNEHVLP